MSAWRPWETCRAAALAAALCLLAGTSAFTQTTSASVSGTVKDPQGAILRGAEVTLTSDTQGTTQSARTDSLGNFLFAYVRPDTYTLSIRLEGFGRIEQRGLVVNANDRIMAGSFVMAVGGVDQTVTVTAPSSDLQLKSGERGFTLQTAAMQNLGAPGRSLFTLVPLVPGVLPTAEAPAQVGHFNINGQRNQSNNYTVDGVTTLDTGNNAGNMVQTNIDAVAEIKVLTSSYQAEYGRAAGGQVQVVTKSGTQRFSGSGYWYGRRSEWNENTWLNVRDGTPKEKSSRNDQGYTFGGPLFVPEVFNSARNKLFFFWSQEFQRRNDPVAERRVTVPTALERQGDFSQTVDNSGNPYPYIRDYTTGLPCNASNTSGCFKYQGVLGRVDPGRLYGPTLATLSLFPLPNVTGEKTYNYKSQEPSNEPIDQSLIRLDYQASGNWRVAGRYMWHSNKNDYPYFYSSVPTFAGISELPAFGWVLSTTGMLDGTTSLEFSVGSGHKDMRSYSDSPQLKRSSSEISALPSLFPEAIQDDTVPSIGYGGRVSSPAQVSTTSLPFENFSAITDVIGNLTKVVGSHAFKAGLYFQGSVKRQGTTSFNGSLTFNNTANNPFDSGHPYANAALGIYQQYSQTSAYLVPDWRYSNVEWYVQDNWKASSNLTLDCGVRFYLLTPQYDTRRLASNWLAEEWDPAKTVRLYAPAVVNGARVGYDAVSGTTVAGASIGRVVPGSGDPFNGALQAGQGISETLTDGSKFRVSPRLGFAYDITGTQRLVARGGLAILYDRPQGNQVFSQINNPPAIQVQTLTWGLARDIATTGGPNATVALTPSAYNWQVPVVVQWNLGVQTRLPAAFTLDVAYVGARADHLMQLRNLNAVPYGAAYLPQNVDPTRGQSCIDCTPLSPVPGGNALPADFMRPYPGYGNIMESGFGSYSNYSALQTTVTRRLSKGLMIGGHYTWSAAKGTLSTDLDTARIDGRDREANYGPLAFDRPHVFVANFVYRAPDVATGALGLFTNGWQVSGNCRWVYGTPYTASFSVAGGSIGPINLTGSMEPARIALTGIPPSKGWSSDPYRQFDLSAFTVPQPGSLGLESPRTTMHMPPVRGLDLSLSKSFPFGGRRRLELRVDAFNALNTVNFTGVNRTIFFSSLTNPTITNLPYDASGNLVNKYGVGTVSAVGSPRQLQVMTRFTF
jgi:hypothetical protein